MDEFISPLVIAVIVLVYTLGVSWRAFQLHKTPRPYTASWCKQFLRTITLYRSSLRFGFLFLGLHAVAFLLPALLAQGRAQHGAALFGGTDLLSAVILYALWKWTSRLITLAVDNVRVD